MADAQPPTFGILLKRLRLAAGLSQEALAERARMSSQAISALERGVRRTPYRDTVALLCDALALSEADRAALSGAAVRRRAPRETALPLATPLAPPDTTLIGRDADIAKLTEDLRSGTRLLTLTGPGGIGKTRLGI